MTNNNSNSYTNNGYKDRRDYLQSLADDYGMSFEEVLVIANTLGLNEDFDGLVTALEDFEDMMNE